MQAFHLFFFDGLAHKLYSIGSLLSTDRVLWGVGSGVIVCMYCRLCAFNFLTSFWHLLSIVHWRLILLLLHCGCHQFVNPLGKSVLLHWSVIIDLVVGVVFNDGTGHIVPRSKLQWHSQIIFLCVCVCL